MKMLIILIVFGMFLLVFTQLVSGASWSAYVFDNSSVGINAVNVTAILLNNDYVNSTLTNANGFFNLTITDLRSVKLISSKSGFLTDTSQILPPISDNQILPFNITLQQALPGNITGKVTNSTGSGIENVTVSAVQENSTINSTSTDSNGDYLLADLLDGTYTIEASSLGYTTQNTTNVVLLQNSTTSVNFSLDKETIPPIISDVSATLITSSEAVIIWQTDELANSSVSYGTTTSTILSSGSSTLTTSHMVRLSSLSSDILYYYNVNSCDFAGNCNTSEQFNFTTLAVSSTQETSGDGGGVSAGGIIDLTTITRILSEGTRMTIKVEGEIHYIEIIELTNTTATINISSTPQQAILSIGEEKKFEVTDDNFYDILVKLNGIENNNANLTASSIHEQIQPRKLLDINLNLFDSLVQKISELVAVVSFENFGEEPIRVNYLFTLLDADGEEVYSEDGSVVVNTERILRKQFEKVPKGSLGKGRYTLILTTLYNKNIVDEFRQEFEIRREGVGITGRTIEFLGDPVGLYWIVVFVMIILISFTVYFIKKHLRDIKNSRMEVEFRGLR